MASELAAGVMKPNSDAVCLSLTNHVAEVFIEELIKTGASNVSTSWPCGNVGIRWKQVMVWEGQMEVSHGVGGSDGSKSWCGRVRWK